MAQVRSDFAEGMKKQGYKYAFEERDNLTEVHPALFKEQELNLAWAQWTSVVEEDEPEEKTTELSDAPVSDTVEGFTVYLKARTFHRRKVWSKETVRDHARIENLVEQSVRNWARGSHSKREKFYAGFFNYGGYTAGRDDTFDQGITGSGNGYAAGDGIYDGTAASVSPFFSTDGAAVEHVNKLGTSYYNAITGSLNEGNLETALILLEYTNAKSERDIQFDQRADTLLVPTHLERTAKKLIESEGGMAEAHSGIINPYQNRMKVVVWKFLTDTDAWFAGIAKRGIVMGKRQEMEINMFIDQRSGNFEAVYDERYGGTVEDYRPWVSSNVSTS